MVYKQIIWIDPAEPKTLPAYPSSFTKPAAYFTHNAIKPLSDITGGSFFRLHAASSRAIKGFIPLR